MVYLGYMIPTDKEHQEKIEELSKHLELSHEKLINQIIDDFYENYFGG